MTRRLGTVLIAAALLAGACGGKDEGKPVAQTVDATNAPPAPTPAPPGKPEVAKSGGDGSAVAQAITPAPNAKVEIIEFSDFQCPFCSKVEPTIAELKKTYGETLRVTFFHQPLPFHKMARGAALAAEAARKQGKFWEMHEKLFANQQALNPPDLERYASELGLDIAKFKADVADPGTSAIVDVHANIAGAVGATGTPAFFVNGKSLRGAQPIDKFKAIIDAEAAEADKVAQKGDAWLEERLKANNGTLFDFIYGGKQPPKAVKPPPPVDRTVYKAEIDPTVDAWKGEALAPVTMVIFSDFQCPFCKKVEPTLAQLMTDYAGKLRAVWKHNPLPFHKDAVPAAHASLCAQEQGKFWEMHDKLFENQAALQPADFVNYAAQLNLDSAKFASCMSGAADKFKARIAKDMEEAGKVTARGTPNVFINGRKVTGAKPLEEFKAVIDDELKKAEVLLSNGTAPADLYAQIIKDGKVFEPLETQVADLKLDPAVSAMDGKKDAKIQVTIFSDFQCPFCSRVAAPLHDLKKKYGEQLVVTFKNFPLSFHQQAMPAAIGGTCAFEQGKFWQYHDAIFAAQKELSPDKVKEVAGSIGLDLPKWEACVAANKYKAQLDADMAEGRAAGVRGTPTVFINGRKFNSPSGYTVDAFSNVIDKYILATP